MPYFKPCERTKVNYNLTQTYDILEPYIVKLFILTSVEPVLSSRGY